MKTCFLNCLSLILILMTTKTHCQITGDFMYSHNEENDVVINEIMVDPEPSVELSCEYVELYNTTDSPVSVTGWTFMTGSMERKISENVVIEPNGYLLLCHEDNVVEMSQYGACCGLSGFKITNAGTDLTLLDADDNVISLVTFDDSWYENPDKADGGWSLEQIDPLNPCAGRENWEVSHDRRGGSPCMLNSVDAVNVQTPRVDYVNMLDDNIIEVHFTHRMDVGTLEDVGNYYIKELMTNPTSCSVSSVKNNHVELVFSQYFEEEVIYYLVLGDITNCSGVPLPEECTAAFGITREAEDGDVLINEVLFNPVEPGVDYVELYNNSDKIIDIGSLRLCSVKTSFPNPPDTSMFEICSESRALMPGKYLLLSQNGHIVGEQYSTETDNFLDMKRFPSYGNDNGIVLLTTSAGSVIDVMHYEDDMHYPILYITKGVSLERISFDKSSSDVDNWHSASAAVNYGTPGCPNSVMSRVVETDNIVTVSPEIFSPDGDGFNETAGIFFSKENTGCTLNVNILDSYGRHVRRLVDNVLVSFEASFFWDGLNDNGSRVTPGIYIVLTELFTMNGDVRRYKNAVVVATK